MEIEYLSEFAVIARLGSFSRAAEELCISQSSLSKHILTLERELGIPLLVRNSRNVTMSPGGAQILSMAVQISELKEQIFSTASKLAQREKTSLPIASIPVMAQYNITGILAGFQKEFPQVALDITEGEHKELREMLESGKCELAFTRWGLEPEDQLEQLPLCRDHLVAVVHKNHTLVGNAEVKLEELADFPLLFLDQRTGFHHLYANLCRNAGFVPNIAYTGHRPENIIDLAAQDMGVALLMQRHIDYLNNPNVISIPIVPSVESSICLVRRKDRHLSGLAQDFWDFVQDQTETDSLAE